MAPTLTINFDNDGKIHKAGETMTGHVACRTDDGFECEEIYVKFSGKSDVLWYEQEHNGEEWEKVSLKNSEKYFKSKVKLLEKVDKKHMEIPSGSHKWPFSFDLPSDLPSSFEGEHGKVRYKAKCVVDKKGSDYKAKTYFTVLSIYDLNKEFRAMAPSSVSDQKHAGCLCCESGPITAEIHLDRTGYTPGESFAVRVSISNCTDDVTLEGTRLNLFMSVTYHAKRKSRTRRRIAACLHKSEELAPGQEDLWMPEQMMVPALPPSGLAGCGIIEIDYKMQLEVVLPMPSINLRMDTPVIIGTKPHKKVLKMYRKDKDDRSDDSDMDDLPVGYSESAKLKKTDSDDSEDEEHAATKFDPYAVQYTTYDWSSYR